MYALSEETKQIAARYTAKDYDKTPDGQLTSRGERQCGDDEWKLAREMCKFVEAMSEPAPFNP